MESKIKKLSKSQIEIEIELSPAEWEEYLNEAAGELSKSLNIEGFRPGKAPRNLVESKIGSERLLETSAERAIRKSYVNFILDNKVDAIGQPEVKVLKIGLGSSFVFQAKVAVLPEIILSDYKKIAQDIKPKNPSEYEPSDKDIQETLEYIRKSRAMQEKTAQAGAQSEGVKGEESKESKEDVSDDKEISDEKEELNLPDINDEFARSLGNFADLEALKKNIKDGLRTENENKESQRWRIEAIKKIADKSNMDVPDILVVSELDKMILEFKNNISGMGMEFDKYLEEIKKTEDDLKKEWQNKAEDRVKISLILQSIAKKEQMEPSEQEVEEEINKFLKHYASVADTKKQIDMSYLTEYTKGVLKNEKVFQFLENFKQK